MAKLGKCITKAGKSLSPEQATELMESVEALTGEGLSVQDAEAAALDDLHGELTGELGGYLEEVAKAGGDISRYDPRPTAFGVTTPAAVNRDAASVRDRFENEAQIDDNPTRVDSIVYKLGETVQDQVESMGKPATVIAKAKAATSETIRSFTLATVPRRYMNDFVTKGKMPAIRQYQKLADRMEGRKNELLARDAKVAEKWAKFSSASKTKEEAGRLASLMHVSTRVNIDPRIGFVVTAATKGNAVLRAAEYKHYLNLKKHYDALSDTGRELYTEVQESYKAQFADRLAAVEAEIVASTLSATAKRATIAKLRKQFDKGSKDIYFPLSRFGDYWASAKEAGKVVSYAKFKNRAEQTAWLAAMRGKYTVNAGKVKKETRETSVVDPEFLKGVIDAAGQVDPALSDTIYQMYIERMPDTSVRKSSLHRVGRLGYSADALRTFSNTSFHSAQQVARMDYNRLLTKAMGEVRKQAQKLQNDAAMQGKDNDKDAIWSAHVVESLEASHEWANNPAGSSLAGKLTSFGFMMYITGSAAAAAINMTQVPIMSFPALAARFDNVPGAIAALAKAGKDIVGKNYMSRLRGDDLRAMKDAEAINVFDQTMAADMGQNADRPSDYNSKWQAAQKLLATPFHTAEVYNRRGTYLAAYRMARAKGMTHAAAVDNAHDLTFMSQFDYANSNRPKIMRNDAAKVLLLFRQYSLNATYRIVRDMKDSMPVKSTPKAVRREARKRLTIMLASSAMFSGAAGFALWTPIAMLLEAIMSFDDDDEPWSAAAEVQQTLSEVLSPGIANAIMNGTIDELTGLGVGSRVGLDLKSLWLQDQREGLTAKQRTAQAITTAAGPVFKQLGDLYLGYSALTDDTTAPSTRAVKGITKVAPKFIRDVVKAADMSLNGVTNGRGDVVMDVSEITGFDVVSQSLGFTPAKVQNRWRENSAIQGKAIQIRQQRTRLLNLNKLAHEMDSSELRSSNMDDIRAFNKRNPGIGIDLSDLSSSIRSDARRSAKAKNGISLPAGLNYLRDEINFSSVRDEDGK